MGVKLMNKIRKNQSAYLTGLNDVNSFFENRRIRKRELELQIATATRLVSLGLNTRYLATIGTILATLIAYYIEVNQFYWLILFTGIGLHIVSAIAFLIEDRRIFTLKRELLVEHDEGKQTTVNALQIKMRREIPTILGNIITFVFLGLLVYNV